MALMVFGESALKVTSPTPLALSLADGKYGLAGDQQVIEASFKTVAERMGQSRGRGTG